MMALTIGTGPLGGQPAGSFDVAPPTRPLLFWEPFDRRLRVRLGGDLVADSRDVVALHETGEMMRLGMPWSDVLRDRLVRSSVEPSKRLGPLQAWSIDDRGVVARSVDAPPSAAAAIGGLVLFDLANVDAWFLEDDLGYAHPRDPYHRVDVHRISSHVIVRAKDAVIGETRRAAKLFETSTPPRVYLPPDAIRPGLLEKSSLVSQCPYKGDGQHWHVTLEGTRIGDAGWSLTTPMGDALTIPRWFSFYPDKVTVEIDGVPL